MQLIGPADPLLEGLRPPRAAAVWLCGGSAAICFILYAALLGVPMATGLMLGLAVHELGHLWVLRRLGLWSSPPVFIPLLGAAIHLRLPPLRPEDQLRLALAGPAFGMTYSIASIIVGLLSGWSTLLVVGVLFVIVNCVDLVPIGSLDGARALRAWRAMGLVRAQRARRHRDERPLC